MIKLFNEFRIYTLQIFSQESNMEHGVIMFAHFFIYNKDRHPKGEINNIKILLETDTKI